jgi:hypothetical protein
MRRLVVGYELQIRIDVVGKAGRGVVGLTRGLDDPGIEVGFQSLQIERVVERVDIVLGRCHSLSGDAGDPCERRYAHTHQHRFAAWAKATLAVDAVGPSTASAAMAAKTEKLKKSTSSATRVSNVRQPHCPASYRGYSLHLRREWQGSRIVKFKRHKLRPNADTLRVWAAGLFTRRFGALFALAARRHRHHARA